MKTLMIAVVILVLSGLAEAAGPAFTPANPSPSPAQVRTVQQSLDAISREVERPKTRATDPGPVGGGGGISGPLGRSCAEARERMRWSDLPCSPFMPAE